MSKHIQSLKDYVSNLGSDEKRMAFASSCGTTLGHLRQVYYGNRSCDVGLAIEIEKNTNQQITCESLRDDIDFAYLRNSASQLEEA